MNRADIEEAFRQPYRLTHRLIEGVQVPYRVIADDVVLPDWLT